ncbi:membrane integrity-associated transporter subunit PqiC [Paracoccaceae bacterium GXU_MW_L88]
MRKLTALLLFPLMSGCAMILGENNHLMPETPAQSRLPVAARGIEVATVDLPLYAADAEMAVANDSGVVSMSSRNIWADEPPRAITQRLASQLSQRVSAAVAAEPWPMLSRPDLRISVKVDKLVGDDDSLMFSGQYFVTAANTGTYEGAYNFSYDIPYPNPQGNVYQNIAAAQGAALSDLADDMAQDLSMIPAGSVVSSGPAPLF